MIPTVTAPGAIPQPSAPQSAQKSAQPQLDAARSSVGEAANATRAETARAIDAPEQSSTAPRLREQETKERPESVFDDLVGPVPTFKESPLERQARTALDPPEIAPSPPQADIEPQEAKVADEVDTTVAEAPVFEDPPPTPSERAEASFAETRILASEPEPATIDVAR